VFRALCPCEYLRTPVTWDGIYQGAQYRHTSHFRLLFLPSTFSETGAWLVYTLGGRMSRQRWHWHQYSFTQTIVTAMSPNLTSRKPNICNCEKSASTRWGLRASGDISQLRKPKHMPLHSMSQSPRGFKQSATSGNPKYIQLRRISQFLSGNQAGCK
jgi:hypothetical protein